eukprot:Em0001g1829a
MLRRFLDDRNGSFQNQSEEASTSKRNSRRASVEAVSAWAELKKKKEGNLHARGNRTTGITEHQPAEKRRKRSKLTIKDASAEQLDALSEFMPDLTDSDAKILALRMYYMELSDGVSSIQAQDKVSIAQLQVIHTQSKGLCIGVNTASTLARLEFRVLVEASSDWF